MIDVEKSGIKEIVEYKQALRASGVFTFPQDMNELAGDILAGASNELNKSSRLDTAKTGAKPTA
jgi:hypothetical protein